MLEADGKEPVSLYSKLTDHGPAKNRDHIATDLAIIDKISAIYPKKVRTPTFLLSNLFRPPSPSVAFSDPLCLDLQ